MRDIIHRPINLYDIVIVVSANNSVPSGYYRVKLQFMEKNAN